MSRTLEHSPLPWITCVDDRDAYELQVCQDGDPSKRVAFLPANGREDKANAAFIVRATRNHHDLVAALRWALERLSDARACCYGGVELQEIEQRREVLKRAEGR